MVELALVTRLTVGAFLKERTYEDTSLANSTLCVSRTDISGTLLYSSIDVKDC